MNSNVKYFFMDQWNGSWFGCLYFFNKDTDNYVLVDQQTYNFNGKYRITFKEAVYNQHGQIDGYKRTSVLIKSTIKVKNLLLKLKTDVSIDNFNKLFTGFEVNTCYPN